MSVEKYGKTITLPTGEKYTIEEALLALAVALIKKGVVTRQEIKAELP